MEGLNPTYYVGLDWASQKHDLCVLDSRGATLTHFTVEHSAAGLAEMTRRLCALARSDQVPVAIERPSGLVVDTLVDAGFPVVPIHPNQLKASRSRYAAARGKSDPGDAYILADLLRTDGHRFRVLLPASDLTRALRLAVRARDDLVATRVALANQLRSHLEHAWPGAAVIFADVDSPIALDFLAQYPSPEQARRLGPRRLERFLARHHYCGRRSVTELLERLRSAPPARAGRVEQETGGLVTSSLVALLRPLVGQIKDLDGSIAALMRQHPDGALIQSFPRTGTINAAQILAELGDQRARFLSPDQLAAEAGVVPVTYASGKHKGVACRFACNKRLRRALTTWADNSRHAHPWAAAIYQNARARGCDHPHAVRILARAWVRILWRCWQEHAAYDPSKHQGAALFLTVPAQPTTTECLNAATAA